MHLNPIVRNLKQGDLSHIIAHLAGIIGADLPLGYK